MASGQWSVLRGQGNLIVKSRSAVSGHPPLTTHINPCPLESSVSPDVLPKKLPNRNRLQTVFMGEGRRVVVGEAILDGAGAIDRNMAERSRDERKD